MPQCFRQVHSNPRGLHTRTTCARRRRGPYARLMDEQPGATLPEERRLHIAAQLRRESRVRVDDLARQFVVSGETIRRDLQVLEERGLLRRVYGGAVVAAPGPWDARLDEHLDPHGPPERQIG